MTERPILFSAPMVRAILAGTKTQTRRAISNPHRLDDGFVLLDHGNGWWPYRSHDGESSCYIERKKDGDYFNEAPLACPYGQPGDRLWVRETWQAVNGTDRARHIVTHPRPNVGWLEYAATPRLDEPAYKWRPSIHMPRWASRITLEITGVRVERLQDISEADALAEGIVQLKDGGYGLPAGEHYHSADPRQSYFSLWEAINGPGSVEANPWLWVVEFPRFQAPGAAQGGA